MLTPPSITINDVAVVEGNSGTSTATFTVSLAPAISQPVTVNYATANGTAASGSDYAATSGTLTFDPSMTTRTISVAITGDATFEQAETFFVNLSQRHQRDDCRPARARHDRQRRCSRSRRR